MKHFIQKLFVGCALISVTTVARANFADTQLGNLLQDVTDAYGWSCRGNACYPIWRNKITTMRSLVHYVDSQPEGFVVDAMTGKQAARTARIICDSRMTGPADWVVTVVQNENRALLRLASIQRAARLEKITTCEKIVK